MSDTPSDAPALFRADRLGLSLAGQTVLSDLSFAILPGLTLVRGGDGRGKTSLLRLIAGTLQPSTGALHRPAGTVFFETPSDPAHDPLVARDWLQALRARAPRWRAGVLTPLVEAFGLAEHLDKPMHMLSTGSRRKVGLVAAAASGAALTLLDMPYAALDARSCRVLTQLLAEAADGRDAAWVIADHTLPAGLAEGAWAGVVDLGD